MRVLFSSTPGYGHVFPMLPLARAFAAAGHEVLWATSAESCSLLDGTGIAAAPAGLSGAGLREGRGAVLAAAGQVPPSERAEFVFPRMFGETFTPAMVDDLLPLTEQWRPDLMIHENGELGSSVVGAVLGVPSITHAFGGAIPAEILAAAGERVAPVWAAHGQELPEYAGCFTSLYLDICPPSVQPVPTDHIPEVQPLRPVADVGPAPDGVPDYLDDDGRPLVYLTLGTVATGQSVLRPAVEALSALPVRLLVAVGPSGDPAALDGQPGHVRVERWVHQPQVLDHATVVVSHAGSGTFLGALARGLPQLCLPQGADQFRNAAAGARTGAVLVLDPSDASPEAVAGAVDRLLSEARFRRDAAAVADEIARLPSPSEVADELARRFGPAPA
jgi:UDP:flavonoid glycosyltransferase YjiC (YdhE family)